MTPYSALVYFETLGCKLNFAESSSLSQSISEKGFKLVNLPELANYCIINTCSVTENADSKCKKLIRDFKRVNPATKIIIIGCYAQLKPEEIMAIDGVDLVLGAGDKFKLLDFLGQFENENINYFQNKLFHEFTPIQEIVDFYPSHSVSERTRSFLKVQDGCDYSCSFCTIPLARGKSRNGTIHQITTQAKSLAALGVKEIVITGINLGDFGKSTNESFLDLIKALEEVNSISRFRVSSIEPNLLSSEIIQFMANSSRFMPHFHIPLQSGSDFILGLMKRRYKTSLYKEKINLIHDLIPEAGIGVDVIVGFPGEGEGEFLETYQFLKELDISYLHVFPYSERNNTFALSLPNKVSGTEKTKRVKLLHDLSLNKTISFTQKNLHKEYPVLLEKASNHDFMVGFTPNYIKLEVPYKAEWANQIILIPIKTDNSILKSYARQPVEYVPNS